MAPPSSDAAQGLPGLLSDLGTLTEGQDSVPLGHLLETLGARGHGPLILFLSAFMMLPTGMLPFMPQITGLLLIAIAGQMVIGGRGVSVPARVARVTLPGPALRTALEKATPTINWLGRVIHPRLGALVQNRLPLSVIALILAAIGSVMIIFGAIPGVPFLLCVPALAFGLGLTAGDGALVALGFALSVVGAAPLTALL